MLLFLALLIFRFLLVSWKAS